MKIATYVTNVIMTRCALAVVPKNTCTHARTMADSTRHALRGELLGAAAAQFEAARAFVAAGFALHVQEPAFLCSHCRKVTARPASNADDGDIVDLTAAAAPDGSLTDCRPSTEGVGLAEPSTTATRRISGHCRRCREVHQLWQQLPSGTFPLLTFSAPVAHTAPLGRSTVTSLVQGVGAGRDASPSRSDTAGAETSAGSGSGGAGVGADTGSAGAGTGVGIEAGAVFLSIMLVPGA